MTIQQKVASGVAAVLATAGIAGSVLVGDRYEVEQNIKNGLGMRF
jgi:hypothetical protein